MSPAGLITTVEIWLAIGAVVALIFVTFGIDRIEPNAKNGYVFRVLILPGLCLLWPLVLWRWRLAESGGEDWRNRHSPQRKSAGWLGFGMAAAIAVILLIAATQRPPPVDSTAPAPEKISAKQERRLV